MRSYDGESSSTEDDDRREGLPEAHLQQGSWQRTASHPTWAWEHRNTVSNGTCLRIDTVDHFVRITENLRKQPEISGLQNTIAIFLE